MPREAHEVDEATLRLLTTRRLGPSMLARLRGRMGHDRHIVDASIGDLADVPGVGRSTAVALRSAIADADPDAERSRMLERGARLILRGDDDFPALLEVTPDPPAALWVRGEVHGDDDHAVAVVGSRRCTAYGREQAGRFAARLAEAGLTVVSGGALGIDAAAHRGTLRAGGRTVAVMGCGLAHTYPPEHETLFEQIVASGAALISEFPMAVPPRPNHFPRRNRIISGLSIGVLLVEAARRSGALITARQAAEDQGREVMALPGRVDSWSSRGTLEAIRDGWAAAVLDFDDVLHQLDSAGHLVRGAIVAAARASREAEAVGRAEEPDAPVEFEGRRTKPPERAAAAAAAAAADAVDGAATGHATTRSAGQRAIIDLLEREGGVASIETLTEAIELPVGRLLAEMTVLEVLGVVSKSGEGLVLVSRSGKAG